MQNIFEIEMPNLPGLNIEMIKHFVFDTANKRNFPVAFEKCQKDSVIAYHPEHQDDYLHLKITYWTEGNFAVVGGSFVGKSKQNMQQTYRKVSGRQLTAGYIASLFNLNNSTEMFFRSLVSGIRSSAYSEEKYNAEIYYYQRLIAICKETFNIC